MPGETHTRESQSIFISPCVTIPQLFNGPTGLEMIELLMQKPEMTSEQGVTIISLGPDYDSIYESSLGQFDSILELAKTVEPPRMIMDLTHTEYFGSAFLGFLLRISNRLSVQRKGRFGICHLSKFCRAVIMAAKLDTLFELFDTRADAVAAFTKDDKP